MINCLEVCHQLLALILTSRIELLVSVATSFAEGFVLLQRVNEEPVVGLRDDTDIFEQPDGSIPLVPHASDIISLLSSRQFHFLNFSV